jgi:hypothetical protein
MLNMNVRRFPTLPGYRRRSENRPFAGQSALAHSGD